MFHIHNILNFQMFYTNAFVPLFTVTLAIVVFVVHSRTRYQSKDKESETSIQKAHDPDMCGERIDLIPAFPSYKTPVFGNIHRFQAALTVLENERKRT